MNAPTTYANPYWDAISDLVHVERYHTWEEPARFIGGAARWRETLGRHDLTSQYAWTITAPDTVEFVVEHAGDRVIDPLAGSGYWPFLLAQHGIDVTASDMNPPDLGGNAWHRKEVHAPVMKADAVEAVTVAGDDRTLLLSWPPYDDPIGARVLAAYRGRRLIYIGEGESGCCGTDEMWAALTGDWVEAASHRPVQWYGLHDWVTIYDRKAA